MWVRRILYRQNMSRVKLLGQQQIISTFARKSTEGEATRIANKRACSTSQLFQGDFTDCHRQQFGWSYCLSHPPPSGKCRKLKVHILSGILLLFWPPSASGLGWSYPPNWPKLVCPRSRNMCSGKGIRVQFALSDQQYTARFCSKNTKLQTLAFELEKNWLAKNPFHIREAIGKR